MDDRLEGGLGALLQGLSLEVEAFFSTKNLYMRPPPKESHRPIGYECQGNSDCLVSPTVSQIKPMRPEKRVPDRMKTGALDFGFSVWCAPGVSPCPSFLHFMHTVAGY